jgi:hypothetical protein
LDKAPPAWGVRWAVSDGPKNTSVSLLGLQPDTVYRVISVDQGSLAEMTGADLMDGGIRHVRSPGTAAHHLSLIPLP